LHINFIYLFILLYVAALLIFLMSLQIDCWWHALSLIIAVKMALALKIRRIANFVTF